jgi:hypothetical protein
MGQGNHVVDDWHGPGAAQMEVLEQYIRDVGNGQLEIDWAQILTGRQMK